MLGRKALIRQLERRDPSSAPPPGAPPVDPGQLAAVLIARADAARDAKRYRDAAALFHEALRIVPDNGGIHVQCGHMYKESGDLGQAEAHYLQAQRLMPDDPDLALQLGHFYKVAGRVRDAAARYERAAALKPGWAEPAAELDYLRRHGWRAADVPGQTGEGRLDAQESTGAAAEGRGFEKEAAELRRAAAAYDRLVPEIVPRKPHEMLVAHREGVTLRRFGKQERSFWGMLPTVRGVDAIRGFCISLHPVTELQVALNGLVIHRGPVRGGYELQYERDDKRLLKYVFNVWLDFSGFVRGRYEMELRFVSPRREPRVRREYVVIGEPLPEERHPDSDGVISLPPSDGRSVEEQVNGRPSVVRPAARAVLPEKPRNVLILRTDQLGDMVTSIPAMRRLRELLPESRFVGLFTASNVDFAATLGLFDELIVVDFPDDLVERKRTMTLQAQEALRERLAPHQFDLAIDLSESGMSRPLLLLSGASFLYGFYDRDWPWLNAGFEGNTRDARNNRETAPHSTRVVAFVERLGALLRSRAEVIRRTDVPRERLASAYGLQDGDRYAVLHTGARIAFSRWAHYGALAALLIERTDLKVVLMADDPAARAGLPSGLLESERFRLIDGRLPFDDFDALIACCAVFVGNDSGPKHLAALRGVKTVSIHCARINWNEWGQEMTGSIISRKVPCAGCAIYHDYEECGQDYACVARIGLEEVFDAVKAQL